MKFAYPTRPLVEIFNDLTFEVEPGMNVSIVGPSGGGKSTISISFDTRGLTSGSLLLRFYDPTSGKITLNGVDIREYSVKQVTQSQFILTIVPTTHFGCAAGTRSVLGYAS